MEAQEDKKNKVDRKDFPDFRSYSREYQYQRREEIVSYRRGRYNTKNPLVIKEN
jgi:hypothetical protein